MVLFDCLLLAFFDIGIYPCAHIIYRIVYCRRSTVVINYTSIINKLFFNIRKSFEAQEVIEKPGPRHDKHGEGNGERKHEPRGKIKTEIRVIESTPIQNMHHSYENIKSEIFVVYWNFTGIIRVFVV